MPDIPCIQRPRPLDIAGPLDDRPPVGEHGELAAVGAELQQESVVAYLAHDFQVSCHLLEIQLARRAVRDLHGVSAAQAGRL